MKIRKKHIFVHILLILLVFIMLYPIVFSVANSFKTQKEIYGNVLSILPENPTLENYETITTKIPYFQIVCNTVFIAAVVMAFKVFTSFYCGLCLRLFGFPGKECAVFCVD